MVNLKGTANRQELIDLLSDLVRIESINPDYPGGKQGEGNVVKYVADYFDKHGIEYYTQEVLPGRSNLIAKLPGKRPGGVCMEAHTDTVTIEGMTIEPFDPVIKDGLLYGRGSCDTKGSLACMMYSMVLLKRLGIVPETDVYLAAAVDEEFRFRGVTHLLEQGFRCKYAITGEPTDLHVVTACKGVARFALSTHGKAGHSSRPDEGHNAIQDMGEILHAIQTEMIPMLKNRPLHPLLGRGSVNVGVINGGVLINIIPDTCRVEIDRRVLPGETYESVMAEFEEIIAPLREKDPQFGCSFEPLLIDYAMDTPQDTELVQTAVAASEDILGTHTIEGVSYGCDGTKLYRAGAQTIVFGPGSILQAHTACEYIDIEHLAPAAEMYAQICATLSGDDA